MNAFSRALLDWYDKNRRDLPWRRDSNPYHVLVSEIMLQQTQVFRVVKKFGEFIMKFPTIQHLAQAPRAEVLKAWSGMGYNRRALLLHRLAQVVVSDYGGKVPGSSTELCKLPGIGPYTAGAIASFAYNKPEPAIDVNVRRVYRRFFDGIDVGLPRGKKEEEKLSNIIKASIPQGKSRIFHNALMDFGSLVCTRDAPRCNACPLESRCAFFPVYRVNAQNALFVKEKMAEPGAYEQGKHVPNRIFRGRIVEFVRMNERKEITLHQLGKSVKKDYTFREKEWLLMRVERLQKEGLITYSFRRNRITVRLAS